MMRLRHIKDEPKKRLQSKEITNNLNKYSNNDQADDENEVDDDDDDDDSHRWQS